MSKSLLLTAFRVIAAIEAVTWVGLLAGMVVKYLVIHNEIGVKVFGPLHGAAFMGYVAVAVAAWVVLRWSPLTGILALVASVPPLGTVVFERWATRTGRVDRTAARKTVPAESAAR
ncbi:DUF3817 domain-containing protein [Marinitenerispora sediminis]|uniref:DUF3817 domain-containing protein n=1 Tax=Marinitenerispora sediminis TaxID=1931232 RepID=A0A368TBL1_9ACTN|nr:DUF3817 domain-containing protein [Marinitenerispora sediminis]RCV58168.1 DUF3817 domain-containing protein [Marinitenerispora sediminis]RCV61459.1 DUF3817 domain-containing protein [Marinitenerispora sediminis]RCV62539.1 DUF3817 domain-containing protein [Marinitenerispora sediminis]